jgi:hypothetical protein
MDAIQQSRQLDQTAPVIAPLDKKNPSAARAALSIRLWRVQDLVEPEEPFWKNNDPAACLTRDLIAASGAVTPAVRGKFLVAVFPGIQPAILSARRLQWALQGFSETNEFAATAAAVLVHSSFDLPGLETDDSALQPLEQATPGQTLLTAKAAELLRDLPGLPMQAAAESGLFELLWRGPEETWTRSSDEEAVSQLIKSLGLEHEVPAAMLQPSAAVVEPPPGTADPVLPAFAIGVESIHQDTGLAASSPLQNRRLLIGVACAALILVVIGAVFAFSHKGNTSTAANAGPPPSSTAAFVPAVSSVPTPAPPPAAATAKPKPQTTRDQEKPTHPASTPSEASTPQTNQQKVVAGKCFLDPNFIPKALDQAEKSRDQGKYDAAERQFRQVLACEPDNARARSGLDRVLLAKQTAN